MKFVQVSTLVRADRILYYQSSHNMDKTCYLHLGLHKTASSSFQQTCAQSRNLLEKAGICYPRFHCRFGDYPSSDIQNHSIPIYSSFSRAPKKYLPNIKWSVGPHIKLVNAEYRRNLVNALLTSNTILVSGEDISLLAAEELEDLKCFIERHGFQVAPFALVRSPYSFMCSALQQRVKAGIYCKIIGLNNTKRIKISNYSLPARCHKISNLISIFGPSLQLFPFASAKKHPLGPVGFLLSVMDLIDPYSVNLKQSNASASNQWVRLQNQVNKKYPAIKKGRINAMHFKIPQTRIRDEKFLLEPDELASVSKQIEEENSIMRDMLGATFCDANYPTATPLTGETVAELFVEIAKKGAAITPK